MCSFWYEICIRNPASLQSIEYSAQNIRYGFDYTADSNNKNRHKVLENRHAIMFW